MKSRVSTAVGATLVAVVGLVPITAADGAAQPSPVIFVHMGSGSAAQFESQAMRFASNGYPHDYIRVLEYDSSSIGDILPDILAELDTLIADLQAHSGSAQIDLVGHSLGGFVSQSYLSTPDRAANVAHYVNIDGPSAAAPPGGVPTLALWAGAAPPVGDITGALNVTLADHEHVEAATSAAAFIEMYTLFNDEAPETPDIVPQPPGRIEISGRVTFFPSNEGVEGATLEIWEIDADTGRRRRNRALATRVLDASGAWGPISGVRRDRHYEFAVMRDGEIDFNYFYEPFLRSDHLIRLSIDSGLDPFIDRSEDHAAVTVIRDKELCGDMGPGVDILEVDGVSVLNGVTATCASVGSASVAVFLFDDGSDGVSDVTTVPFPFAFLAHLTGADLYIPTEPSGSVSVELVSRTGGAGRTLNVPNHPSTQSRIVVRFNDFEQTGTELPLPPGGFAPID